jgi:hypothetical protein
MVMRFRATIVVLVTAVLLTSCSQRSPVEVYPVRGIVLYKDRPATGARVVFHPLGTAESGRPLPQATVEENGAFRLSTYVQHDGAPPGKYAVTILWPSDVVKEEDGTPAGPDRLKGRYSDPQRTPLQVEIHAQPNELEPFYVK